MAGITFQDVVIHVEPLTETLLFHKLVHAVQYKHLGLRGFADAYVRGFLRGGSYEQIPLEKQAYELEGRFAADPAATFSVEVDVRENPAAPLLASQSCARNRNHFPAIALSTSTAFDGSAALNLINLPSGST